MMDVHMYDAAVMGAIVVIGVLALFAGYWMGRNAERHDREKISQPPSRWWDGFRM